MIGNELALQVEFDYRRDRLLAEAAAERTANQLREAAATRSG